MTAGTAALSLWAGLTTAAAPVLRVMLRRRVPRGKEIAARLPERRGIERSARPRGTLIWIHAASVGEAVSILPVVARLAARAPEAAILLTTGTVTSAALLDQRLPEMGLAGRVSHRFVPLDVPVWAARFLDHWRPDVAGFVESELWPNLLTACRARGIPAMLINARMSARSFAAWSRVPSLARAVLGGFARIQARGEEDAARLRVLGATAVASPGDLKLAAPALPADPTQLAEMTARLAGHPVFLAASTHPGEEDMIRVAHEAVARIHAGLITIVAPRHPERGAELAALLRAPRRAEGPPHGGGLWIADSMGELGLWYRLSHAVVVGRSLIPPGGGQNPLEPARLGCAIASGPHTGNFAEHVAHLRAADALTVVPDIPALIRFANGMLADPTARQRMGSRAKAAVHAPEALPDDTARELLSLIPSRAEDSRWRA
jgi:3-deoxy-D-manno-octulosonic-acid transferase